MPDKDPHQKTVDEHFKNIHVSRPASKPMSAWTDQEIQSGWDRNSAKWDAANKEARKGVSFNPFRTGPTRDKTLSDLTAADDSLDVIRDEESRRVKNKQINRGGK